LLPPSSHGLLGYDAM